MLLALTALTGCGGGEEATKAEVPATEAAATDAAAPVETAAAPTGPQLIPDYIQGTWMKKGTTCEDGSDTLIVVTGNEIRFTEAVATVTKAEGAGMDSIVVDADLAMPGTNTNKVQYSLAPGDAGQTLTVTDLPNGNFTDEYERCGA